RSESTPHINAKGIMTLDRKPKDGYRFYQANLLPEPYIQIGTKEWNRRIGFALEDTSLVVTQPVQVFSNQRLVHLTLNGRSIGTQATNLGIAEFDVPFVNGINRLVASAKQDKG